MEINPKKNQVTQKEDLPIFLRWMDFLKWLLAMADGLPRKARFTFAERIINLSLSIVEDLIEARYSKNKEFILKRVNLNIEKMRILLRICHESKYLSYKSYEYASYNLNEIGKMLGGWMRQQYEL